MIYQLTFSPQAEEDLKRLKCSDSTAYNKATRLIRELQIHPRTGTGKPEPLTGDRNGQWSRRITRKHRLVYSIHDTLVNVYVISSYGHYDDK